MTLESEDNKLERMDVDQPTVAAAQEPMNVDNEAPVVERKLQKVIELADFVPYSDHLTTTRDNLWANLKKHLCSALMSQGESLQEWIYACDQ